MNPGILSRLRSDFGLRRPKSAITGLRPYSGDPFMFSSSVFFHIARCNRLEFIGVRPSKSGSEFIIPHFCNICTYTYLIRYSVLVQNVFELTGEIYGLYAETVMVPCLL